MKKVATVLFLILSINAQSNSFRVFGDESINENFNKSSVFLQNTNFDEIDKYDYKFMLSNKYSLGQDTIIAGFDDFSVIANANGSCTESSPCQGSQDWGNFNQTYTGRVNQSDGSGWFFSGGGVSDNQYQSMLNRIIRDSGWDYLANDIFEYRWTYEDDNYAHTGYGNGSLIRVPFEVWNVTKGFRLLVWMLDYDSNLKFGLHATDHPGSVESNDPYTDWIYPRMPIDLTPGEQGYQNWLQASIDAGVAMGGQSTPDANGLYLGQYDHSTNSGIDYFDASLTGEEVMGRNVWYAWNLDDVSDGTIDAYAGNDADGDGIGDNTGMEKGTVVQITLGSVKYDEFSWRDSILTDEVYIDNNNLSDTLIVSWNASRSNSHGVHDYKLYIDGALFRNYSGITPPDSNGATLIYDWFWYRFTYQDFLNLWPSQSNSRSETFTFDVWAYLNGDSLQISNKRYVLANRNEVPVLAAIPDTTMEEDKSIAITLSATDDDGDAITFSVKDRLAKNYLNFDGTSNWIQTKNQMGEEDHPIPDEGDFSVSVWARANASASGLMEIYSQGKQPRNIYLGSSGPLGESKYIRAGDSWGNTGVAFPIDDMWHHYVIIKSSSNAYLYLDGELAATKGAAIDNPNPEGSGLYIGKQYSEGDEYFDGNIAELSVWDAELSATEIKTIYNSGLFLSPMRDTLDYKSSNNVTIYYSLNEGEGSTVYGKEYNSSEVFTGEIKGDAIWTKTVESLVTATISGSTLTLVPDANWHGEVNYIVSASDGYSASSTNFNLTVTPVQDAPYSFDWLSTASDTIDITKDVANLAEVYKLEWTESKDVDGDTIDYLLYVKIGLLESEEIYDTTSTSIPITYQEFADNVFEPFPMLPRVTVKFSVVATDGIDTVNVMGDDRVVYVNRYEFLSTESEGIPTEFALHENYPNPFNPTTTLRFDLPEVSNITLTIYNMLGQRVRTFKRQSTPAGYHSVKWDATNDYGEQVGAGVYLYQLQTKDFVKTRKMVLLK